MNLGAYIWSIKLVFGTGRTLASDEIIAWPHLGLGDQISMIPALESLAKLHSRVHLPVKAKNLAVMTALISYIEEIEVHEIPDDAAHELDSIRALSNHLNLPVLYAGHLLYNTLESRIQSKGINGLLALLLGYEGDLTSARLRHHLLSNFPGPSSPQDVPYRFIDHHPGTEREIPARAIECWNPELSSIYNAMSIDFLHLGTLMSNARELHLMSSAPLCLALAADLGSNSADRFRYRVGESFPLRGDYGSDWREVSVSNSSFSLVNRELETKSPGQLERAALRLLRWLYRIPRQAPQLTPHHKE